MQIKLGSKVRDTISGYEGVAVARTEYLFHSARMILVASTKLQDGGIIESGFLQVCGSWLCRSVDNIAASLMRYDRRLLNCAETCQGWNCFAGFRRMDGMFGAMK
jgi:hypothetical protein